MVKKDLEISSVIAVKRTFITNFFTVSIHEHDETVINSFPN